MKLAGIVAEFNPLHNGHEYIISETRRLTGCESVVIAMSGNYVQRGEPALVDKWSRAEMALKSGADLVIEIPTLFCLGNASQYASAGVALLEALDKSIHICCGSESGDSEGLSFLSSFIKLNGREIDALVKSKIKEGLSYPSAREHAIISLMKERELPKRDIKRAEGLLKKPNDILALEYLMASSGSELRFIERKGSGYDDDYSENFEYQSAGAIRNLIKEKGADSAFYMLRPYVPHHVLEMLKESELCFSHAFTEYLRFAAMQMSAEEIDEAPSGGEGLGYLIKEAALKYDNLEDIIMHCKSKRYTYSRISRLCMQIVLGIKRSDYQHSRPKYIRVLGANKMGRKLLSEIKKKEENDLPIITNINKSKETLDADALKMLSLDVKSSNVYNLALDRNTVKFSDHRMKPIII